jgi:uncharacterized membrane protein
LTTGAFAALVRRRELLAFTLLGLALTAKVYPAVLVPLALMYVWTTGGARRARDAVLVLVGVAGAVVAPFAAFGARGLWDSFTSQATRGLQIESSGAAILLAADQLELYSAEVVRGSTQAVTRDLGGSVPDAIGTASSLVQLAAIALIWVLYARRRSDPAALALAFAAATASFLAWNRFLSPQYLVWLAPLVLIVPGSAGVVSWGLLGALLLLAQAWFFHWPDIAALHEIVWLVVIRDALLVALSVLLTVALAQSTRLKTSTPSSA